MPIRLLTVMIVCGTAWLVACQPEAGSAASPVDQECQPLTCEQSGVSCGSASDGCGQTLDCGACPPGQPQPAASCMKTSCSEAGAQCGSIDDGCGGALDCGACALGWTCGVEKKCAPLTPTGESTVSVASVSTAGDCADVAVPQPTAPVVREIDLPAKSYCLDATSDGSGAVAVTARVEDSWRSELHVFSPDGQPGGVHSGSWLEVVAQPSGFHGVFTDVQPGPAEFRALDSSGGILRTTSLSAFDGGYDEAIIAPNPNGGSLVASRSDLPIQTQTSNYYEHRYMARHFGVDGEPVGPALEVMKMSSGGSGPVGLSLAGVAPQGHALFGTGFRTSRYLTWLSQTMEKAGGASFNETWPGGFLLNGSYVLWDAYRDYEPVVIALPPAPDAPTPQGAGPEWLNEVRGAKISFLPSRNGYAVVLNGQGCGSTIQIRSKTGALCSVVTVGWDATCLRRPIDIGWDGTVIQQHPRDPQRDCDASGCKCAFRWWPRLLQ